jgi:hypothetical protein
VRLRKLEQTNKEAAKPVEAPKTERSLILPDNARISVKGANAPPGSAFTRLAMAIAYGNGDTMKAIQRAKEWKGDMPEITAILEAGITNIMDGQKAAVGAGTTTDATFASPLIFYQVMVDQFIQLLRPRDHRTDSGLRMVPFNIQCQQQPPARQLGGLVKTRQSRLATWHHCRHHAVGEGGRRVIWRKIGTFLNPAAEPGAR